MVWQGSAGDRRPYADQHSNGADAPDGACDHVAAARGSFEPLGRYLKDASVCGYVEIIAWFLVFNNRLDKRDAPMEGIQ